MNRKRVYQLIIITGILVILSACGKKTADQGGITNEKAGTAVQAESQNYTWYTLEEGMKLAEGGNKHIIIDFYTDWCKWCKVMEKETFSDPEVEKYLFVHFIPIRIAAESEDRVVFKGDDYSYSEITRAFRVTGFPSLAYMTPSADLITVIPGYIENPQFLKILKYMSRGCYTQLPFDQFDENKDCLDAQI